MVEQAYGDVETPDAEQPTVVRRQSARRRDQLLEVIRGIAIIRVVLWHTWSWWWLSWIPAMPVMFFTTGALLEQSLAKYGWRTTITNRVRRLFIPYWVYALTAVVTMLVSGWRPDLIDIAAWVVPLWDPTGPDSFVGLWIPLWYVRAYLWFLLLSAVIRWVHQRLGIWSVFVAALAVPAMWFGERNGYHLAYPIVDFVTYLPFVFAGMHYWQSPRETSRRNIVIASLGGLLLTASAVAWWLYYGPPSKVVNASSVLMLLVGMAGVCLALAARPAVQQLRGPLQRLLHRINQRALTIFLWQGWGLVAADRLVYSQVDNEVIAAILAIVVVVAVCVFAVRTVGVVEDFAARRKPSFDRQLTQRIGVSSLALIAVVAGALIVEIPDDHEYTMPKSGQAIVERADDIQTQLDDDEFAQRTVTEAPGTPLDEVIANWVADYDQEISSHELEWVRVSLIDPNNDLRRSEWVKPGEMPPAPDREFGWLSMSKLLTVVWLMQVVEAGELSLDTPLAQFVPEFPRSDEITLSHLAHHRSGINEPMFVQWEDIHPRDWIDSFIENPEFHSDPGTEFFYSRMSYFLLALSLERHSGTVWSDKMLDLADQAGASIYFDDHHLSENDEITDPDGHGYRGNLWSSGAIMSGLDDVAKIAWWVLNEAVSDDSLALMTEFSVNPAWFYFGMGLAPICPPCHEEDGFIFTNRFGIDTLGGMMVMDGETGAAAIIHAYKWWSEEGPFEAVQELAHRVLDSGALPTG